MKAKTGVYIENSRGLNSARSWKLGGKDRDKDKIYSSPSRYTYVLLTRDLKLLACAFNL